MADWRSNRNLTVVVHPAERQYHRQQQAYRHNDREVHDGAKRDEIDHDMAAVLIVGGLAKHPRQLVGQQDRHQYAGDGQPGLHDLAQQISLHGPFHGAELRA